MERPRAIDSGPRAERFRLRGVRVGGEAGLDGLDTGGEREMFEALREGGPRKREGGGARLGLVGTFWRLEGGERVAIAVGSWLGYWLYTFIVAIFPHYFHANVEKESVPYQR